MKNSMRFASGLMFMMALVVAVLSSSSRAQTCTKAAGETAVYASCSGGTNLQGSSAYIDTVGLTGGTGDVCAQINTALKSAPAAGAVIDARGVLGSGGIQLCSASPWTGTPSSGHWPPATILLPAGVIVIPGQWILPNQTRIIGHNAGPASAGGAGNTTIRACVKGVNGCTAAFSGSEMIVMGSSATVDNCASTGCTGIGIEDLWLDGQGIASLSGLYNNFAVDLSYAKHVNLYQILGNGLWLTGTSQNSGPYTDIGFSLGSASATSTVCVRIANVATRGVHGLTCSGSSSTEPNYAVVLDASSTSIEDVEIQNFKTGVLVGANDPARDDALLNIQGGTNVSTVVSISGGSNAVSDIAIVGVTNGGNSSATTISDNRTSPATNIKTATVGLYVLGDQVDASGSKLGFSRFTTDPTVPSWSVEGAKPSPLTGCTVGSLYSNSQGTGTGSNIDTWYVCLPKNKCSPTTATCWTPIG